jgi:hypothetical protein
MCDVFSDFPGLAVLSAPREKGGNVTVDALKFIDQEEECNAGALLQPRSNTV